MKKPEEERQKLGFLLPDLLGKPLGVTDKKGNMIFPDNQNIPPENYIFFIPVNEWQEIVRIVRR